MRQQPQQEQVRGVKGIKEKCVLPPALPRVGIQQKNIGQGENFQGIGQAQGQERGGKADTVFGKIRR